jgi:hypothetical protein
MTTRKTPSKGKNSGRWTDEEHERFEAAIQMYGADDMKMLEKHIGTRDVTQIRTHYRHLNRTNPDILSPEKIGAVSKKRTSAETSSSPKKKPKTKGPEGTTPKKPATASKKALASANKVPAGASASKKKSKSIERENASASSEDVYDGKPPPIVEPKKGPKTKKTTPAKTSIVGKTSSPTADEGEILELSVQERLVGFMKKEEVQTVIAGILGFVLVLAVKKYFM